METMNTKNIILSITCLIFLMLSCSEDPAFLEPYPDGSRTGEDVWKYPEMARGLIGRAYDFIPDNYDDNYGAYLDCATDNAVSTSTTMGIRKLATGNIDTGNYPFNSFWGNAYEAIFLVNTFLKDDKGYNTRYIVDDDLDQLVRDRLQGEAYALRAWYHWKLLQLYGGESINGELLGVPIVTEPLDLTETVDLPRDTYDACVEQILQDCDLAYQYLPLAHRDFLVEDFASQRTYAGSRYFRRMSGIIVRAMQANVCLTWASPRFNPTNDNSRWAMAAEYAKEVMDFKLNVDNVSGGFDPVQSVNWVNPNFPGVVFVSEYDNNNSDMERMFYPGGFQGDGMMGATQELVDAFPMANGYPIDDSRSGYDPENPYEGRDMRFYNTIFHNMAEAKRNETGAAMYTFETWDNGGKDAPLIRADNTRTGYYIKKFLYMGLNFSDNNVDEQPRSKFLIRWAHMCLAFAEAANHDVGPTNSSKYGISAKDAIKYLRSRKVIGDQGGITDDPYLDEVAAAGEAAFDEFVKNERRIETCFEGMRFFDLRRWNIPLSELNKSVHAMQVTKDGDDFTYNSIELENRSFTSPYLPIPYGEILRMDNLEQNEGWEGWK